jgi:hypothetical protein
VLVVLLGSTAAFVLVRVAANGEIPTVRNVSGRVDSGTVIFSWNDPGLQAQDAYQVSVGTAPPSIQRGTEFRVDLGTAGRVCITVTVNRDGKTGQPSTPKCVDSASGT